MSTEKFKYNVSPLQPPEELLVALRGIGDKIIETQKTNQKSGNDQRYLSSILFTKIEKVYLDTFIWLDDTNNVVENLNIVFSDLNLFWKKQAFVFKIAGGSLKNRFYLLLRTFFYEFFRIKELFNKYLNDLRKRKIITKREASDISSDFYRDYELIFNLRNQLVHRRDFWDDDEHFDYRALETAESMGYFFANKESGEIIKSEDLISKLAANKLEGLPKLLTAIIEDLQDVLNVICSEIKKEV